MNRPTPRKSSLAGATPLDQPGHATGEPASVPEPATAEAAPARQPEPPLPAKGERKKYPPKVSFYQQPADTARLRAALLHTQADEGPRSLSQFINQAVMTEVQRLENKYNDGQPWRPVGSRELPQGRPMGE